MMIIDPVRSKIMRSVKCRNTAPEMIVRHLVYSMGYRYRLHVKDLPGKPDLVFKSKRKVIFVNGCFWHGHDCKHGARVPKSNQEYWIKKICRNKFRDNQNYEDLKLMRWEYLIIWECHLKDRVHLINVLKDYLG